MGELNKAPHTEILVVIKNIVKKKLHAFKYFINNEKSETILSININTHI